MSDRTLERPKRLTRADAESMADDCRALAQQTSKLSDREMLIAMAAAWEMLITMAPAWQLLADKIRSGASAQG
jgi:hypothetical protein